jgi:hypothetical protein
MTREEPHFQNNLSMWKTHLSTFATGNVVGHSDRSGLGTSDTGITRIRKEIFAQSFRQWTLKVGNVQGDTLNLSRNERWMRKSTWGDLDLSQRLLPFRLLDDRNDLSFIMDLPLGLQTILPPTCPFLDRERI